MNGINGIWGRVIAAGCSFLGIPTFMHFNDLKENIQKDLNRGSALFKTIQNDIGDLKKEVSENTGKMDIIIGLLDK